MILIEPISRTASVRIHADDDVAVALRDLAPGDPLAGGGRVAEPVARGHKAALHAIPSGALVRKYGAPIGRATRDIPAGAHVHTHNLETRLDGALGHDWRPARPDPAPAQVAPGFMGYRRADGRVGTRNEIWIIPTVGCVNGAADRIAREAGARLAGRIDGVHVFPHPFGCSQLGDDLDRTRRVLAALARHPNAGGVLILGLGCESNTLDALLREAGGATDRVRALAAQGETDEIEAGVAAVMKLARIAAGDARTPCAAADLVVGLKCGGSDGFSGISANPALGRVSDRLAGAGGSPVLTEIPEIFGAESLLLERAANRAVFDAAASLIDDFRRYFTDHGQPVHANPSPGNIAGGITTLEEKSLGAVQKAGRAPLTQVLRYGEQVSKPGLALLEAPGNDAVSTTALAAAGATVILFTTGRGTPLGSPVPTLKIASNAALAARKPGWIDFDAGPVLDGESPQSAGDRLFDLVLRTASGEPARNEINGERGVAIWKDGVTL